MNGTKGVETNAQRTGGQYTGAAESAAQCTAEMESAAVSVASPAPMPAAPATSATSSPDANIALRRAVCYVAITFAITWALWITVGMLTDSFVKGYTASSVMFVCISLGMFVPMVGAFLTNLILGKRNRLDLKLRPRIRGNVRFYLLAWFTPTVITFLGAALYFLVVPGSFDPGMSSAYDTLAPALVAAGQSVGLVPIVVVAQTAFAIVLAPFINMIPAFGEEVGWRGMLFPSLCERFSERSAVLIGGVIWGLWHAPATVMGHDYGLGAYWGYPVTGILCMCVFCTSCGACLAYLRVRAQSVWPCALAHGAINAICGVTLYFCAVSTPLLGPSPVGLLAGIPLIVLGLWCWSRLSSTPVRQKR